MTVADWCIPGAVLIYLLTIAWAKASGGGEYSNAAPRDPAFYAAPIRARALGAHQNGIEAFPFFAVAVVLAEVKGGPPHLVDALAVAFLALRVGYVVAYITDRPTLRTSLWTLGLLVNLAIFVSPLLAR